MNALHNRMILTYPIVQTGLLLCRPTKKPRPAIARQPWPVPSTLGSLLSLRKPLHDGNNPSRHSDDTSGNCEPVTEQLHNLSPAQVSGMAFVEGDGAFAEHFGDARLPPVVMAGSVIGCS